MIVAFCDACGTEIPAGFSAGIRYVVGKKEFSGHLCDACQNNLINTIKGIHRLHPLRKVRDV